MDTKENQYKFKTHNKDSKIARDTKNNTQAQRLTRKEHQGFNGQEAI
jgi:hypothetical protein